MCKVKICGITRKEDIFYVNNYLPEYIGFIFANSKRQVTTNQVIHLKEDLDKRIKTVGVFVNTTIENVINAVDKCGLDVIQLHGDETTEYVENLKNSFQDSVDIWKAVRVKDESSITVMANYEVDAFLLDTYAGDAYGGQGKTFNWNLAKEAYKYGPTVLAGGLNEYNVATAKSIVKPFALDVSSGVESNGVKDENRIRNFISAARS